MVPVDQPESGWSGSSVVARRDTEERRPSGEVSRIAGYPSLPVLRGTHWTPLRDRHPPVLDFRIPLTRRI